MAGISFMLLNVFDALCVATIETSFCELGERNWGWFYFGLQMLMDYVVAMAVYQINSL